MIRVKYVEKNNKFISLEVSGHAESSKKEGHDLVCSAVSACTIGALNALNNVEGFSIKIDDGFVSVKALRDTNPHDKIVLETLMVQLESIEVEYKQFIKITK